MNVFPNKKIFWPNILIALLISSAISSGFGKPSDHWGFFVLGVDSPGTAAIVGESKQNGLILKAFVDRKSTSLVFQITNASQEVLNYLFVTPTFGFRFKLYDSKKNPIALTSAGAGIVASDSKSRTFLGKDSILPGNSVVIRLDIEKYFQLPPNRPAEIYLSLWWYPGYSTQDYRNASQQDVSLWCKVDLK